MSDPILRRFTTEKSGAPGRSLGTIIAELSIAGIRAVADDIERQSRYGEITNCPISVDFSDVRLENVTAVLPVAQKNQLADDIRSAVIQVFKQGDSR